MHSSLVRLQNVFGFFTTVAFTVASLIALSVFISPQSPSAEIKLRNIQVVKGRPHYYSSKREEYAYIKFDLDANFTSLFNWNTKQLFVYVLATYPSSNPSSPPSQAIIWDLIIPSPSQANPPSLLSFLSTNDGAFPPWVRGKSSSKSPKTKSKKSTTSSKSSPSSASPADPPGILHLRNVKPKYQITDITGRLSERGNATLEIGWNVQPWVGALTWTNRRPVGPWGRWQSLQGGRSETFEFPPLKGKKVDASAKAAVEKEEKGKGVPKAGEATPVV